jgi:hypothetical protein
MAAAMWVRLSRTGAELAMAKLVNVSISGAFLETSLQLPANCRHHARTRFHGRRRPRRLEDGRARGSG